MLAAAARHPAAPALLAADGTAVPYSWLAEQVGTLTARLTADGVQAGSVVAVEAARGPWLPVALLAVWRTGAVAALLDGTLPALRLAACSRPAAPAARTAAAHRRGPGPGAAGRRHDAPYAARREPCAVHLRHLRHAVRGGGAARGTGGRAGLVRGGLRRAEHRPHGAAGGPGTRPGAARPVRAAEPGRIGRAAAGRRGGPAGRAAGAAAQPRGDPAACHPALLELLVAGHTERPGLRLDALRLVMSGGAPLTTGLVRRLRGLTQAAVVNAYGATETPQIAAHHLVAHRYGPVAAPGPDETTVPVGAGAAGSRAVVLAPDGSPAGIGQRGEILIRGALLARGYLDGSGPQQRFVADPGGVPHAGAYRTGDLGRLDPAGRVHVEGRMDRQVSVNGYRVGLEEVEGAALRHPDVLRAAAALTEDGRLAVWVVARPGSTLTEAALRRQLSALLPPLAVPSLIVPADGLRVDANHKVVVDPATPATPIAPIAPAAKNDTADPARPPLAAGSAAAVLAAQLRALTGRDIDPDENFFDIGLNSMTLLRLHESLRHALPDQPAITGLTVTDLFTHPSPRALLRFLSDRSTGDEAARHRRTGVSIADLNNAGERRRAIRRRIHHEGRSTHE
ncbi:AMP-binding protein [Streptacidiphilus sp. 4-A2]|nr:AMP-binding protein [Streptacidiphilus sp. 4-A2]